MSFSSSNVDMETSAPLVNGIVNNPLLHSDSDINQTLPLIIINLHLFPVVSFLNYTPDFVVNWVEIRAVRRPQTWRDECRKD